ncbi:MAG TPA: hypothetical protein VFL69_08020 [Marmoricola sp.]|nr:hypothetical protein [Marmoricola sp.]
MDEHTHLWRTPHGRYRLVDQRGTHTVDTGPPGRPDRPAGPLVIEHWHTPALLLEYAA